jgi:hypothetical protein
MKCSLAKWFLRVIPQANSRRCEYLEGEVFMQHVRATLFLQLIQEKCARAPLPDMDPSYKVHRKNTIIMLIIRC